MPVTARYKVTVNPVGQTITVGAPNTVLGLSFPNPIYDYLITGSAALAADNEFVLDANVALVDGLTYTFLYDGTCTNAGGSIVILGQSFSANQLSHGQVIVSTYLASSGKWNNFASPNTFEAGSLDGGLLESGSVPVTALSSAPWELAGNAGTNPAANFLGTTDNNDVKFKRNNILSALISLGNTIFGVGGGASISSGSGNTVIGVNAMRDTTTGNSNTVIGDSALTDNITGSENVVIGTNAASNPTTLTQSVIIGANSGVAALTGTNRIGLGYSAAPTKNNQFSIPSSITEVMFYQSQLRVGSVVEDRVNVTANATATLTGAQIVSGFITCTSGAATSLTLPTGTDLGAAVSAVRGTVIKFYIDNTLGANNVTIIANTDAIQSALSAAVANADGFGKLVIPAGASGLAEFTIMFSSATTYVFSRTA